MLSVGYVKSSTKEGQILIGSMTVTRYAIAQIGGIQGYGGRRWVFIVDGLVTVVVAVIAKSLTVSLLERGGASTAPFSTI